MTLVITGHRGLLGRVLMARLAAHAPIGLGRPGLELADPAAVDAAFDGLRPTAVIHCAAFTRVDDCEGEPERARRDNPVAAANIAAACARHGAQLVALSTDHVFDGRAGRPYREDDAPAPRSVYGHSKRAAEVAVARRCPDATILRVAWLYGPGDVGFVHTITALGARPGPPLRVVDDQLGDPTPCAVVADVIEELLRDPLPGVVHATCEGGASRYAFAVEILRLAGLRRAIEPCPTAEHPRPAIRPPDSRLDNQALRLAGRAPLPHWRDALARYGPGVPGQPITPGGMS